MGCCPSKHKTGKAGDLTVYGEYPPTEKVDIDFTLSERPTSAALPVCKDPCATKSHGAPSDMLMDRGDGCAIERSDHEANNDDVAIVIEEDSQINHEMMTGTGRPAEKTSSLAALPPLDLLDVAATAQSFTSRLQQVEMMASPSKPPVNFEDMPINSMYHRIHLVEVEEMEERRRQELQDEAERREREIQEFKAAMLIPAEGQGITTQ